MSSNIKQLTTKQIAKKTGLGYSAAYKRRLKYERKEITYKEAIEKKKDFHHCVAELEDGTILTPNELCKIKECTKTRAYSTIARYNKALITEEELKEKIVHRNFCVDNKIEVESKKPSYSRPRDYNLKKIPQPTKWELENMI